MTYVHSTSRRVQRFLTVAALIVGCFGGLATTAHAQEIWTWDMVIRGTGLITPPPLQLPPPAPPVPTTVSTDVWLATDNPLAPQVAVADPLQFPNDAVENAVTHEILVADSYNARVLRF